MDDEEQVSSSAHLTSIIRLASSWESGFFYFTDAQTGVPQEYYRRVRTIQLLYYR